MLNLDAITFAYPGQNHTYRLSMEAQAGVVTAIMGESGAGKSTLLDLIAGFLAPTSGRMELDGEDLLPLRPEERPVSILFQSEMLFEHLSASANVALGLPKAHKGDMGRISQALSAVGLSGFDHQIAATLSGGQKQRVALARTLLRNKPILLLDEPFSALDDQTRVASRDLVRDLTEARGWHTILVTHHEQDVRALAASTYRLADGALLRG